MSAARFVMQNVRRGVRRARLPGALLLRGGLLAGSGTFRRRAFLRGAFLRRGLRGESFRRRRRSPLARLSQVVVEVEAEQLFNLAGDGREHGVGQARQLAYHALARARLLRLAAAARLVLFVEEVREADAD